MKPPPKEWKIPPAPVLDPEAAMKTFKLEKGFRLELVAAEPMVEDPVALTFDPQGRMWVVEMRSFMPDVDGKNEEVPTGRISILEDTNGDGKADRSKVFLDKIVLPRAIAMAYDGILYADQESLYFVPVKDGDQPGEPVMVDEKYSEGGNVEHKPNGLLYALDNWYYNAKSDTRYRRIDGEWVKEKTEFRGQWGIAQDDYGRLVTNTNSNLISAESLFPGITERNPNYDFEVNTVARMKDQTTWPSRINPGVNRGYMEGTLTKDGYLAKPTAACGLTIYRGNQFPADYYGSAFIPEPSGNLVKRVKNDEDENGLLSVSQANDGDEFLTSTDERSRIVNAYTAPDGTLYLVEFYRGVLQHVTYVTTYLRRQILERGLDAPLGLGRIYRVVYEDNDKLPPVNLAGASQEELVAFLGHPNGWVRDTAQRVLVQSGDAAVAEALRTALESSAQPQARIHALWTLEGLGILKADDVALAAASDRPKVAVQAARAAQTLAAGDQASETLKVLSAMSEHPSAEVRRQVIAALGRFEGESEDAALTLLAKMAAPLSGDKDALWRDVTLSGLTGKEFAFLEKIDPAANPRLSNDLVSAIVKSGKEDAISALVAKMDQAQDAELFRQFGAAVVRARKTDRVLDLVGRVDTPTTPADIRKGIVSGMLAGKSGKFRPFAVKSKPAFLGADTPPEGLSKDDLKKFTGLFDFSGKGDEDFLKSATDKALFAKGQEHYQRVCLACHQFHGRGLEFLAPPLVESEWVMGPKKRLISLVMDGLQGPVEVNGKLYEAPSIQPLMPGLRLNPEVNDEQLAAILTYVRNAWGNGGSVVKPEEVVKFRKENDFREPYTAEELEKVK